MSDADLIDAGTATVFGQALQLHQLGILDRAGRLYVQVLEKYPQYKQAMYLYNRLRREAAGQTFRAGRTSGGPWRVVWQHPPSDSWEEDWLGSLLADVIQGERVIDTTHSVVFENMIVIDHRMTAQHESYYANAAFQGCNVVLFHLSDEWYADDYAAYTWCDRVFRNHWTFMHADNRKVMFIPLGYKNGFSRPGTPKSAAARRYRWSFVGDSNKSTRRAMLDALRSCAEPRGFGEQRSSAEYFVHATSGFNGADALPTDRYHDIMDDSILVPCPAGWQNLESFRTWEALEAGCIPIVERRPHFDYYAALCGDYPFPSVTDWAQAATLLQQSDADLEVLRRRCADWWRARKASLRERIGGALLRV
jgi:hypothetical protein